MKQISTLVLLLLLTVAEVRAAALPSPWAGNAAPEYKTKGEQEAPGLSAPDFQEFLNGRKLYLGLGTSIMVGLSDCPTFDYDTEILTCRISGGSGENAVDKTFTAYPHSELCDKWNEEKKLWERTDLHSCNIYFDMPELGITTPGSYLVELSYGNTVLGTGNVYVYEQPTQNVQLLDCTETELMEGFPDELTDYHVTLKNPNTVPVEGTLCGTTYVSLEPGETKDIVVKLSFPPSGQERQVYLTFDHAQKGYLYFDTGLQGGVSFGYFTMRSQAVAEGELKLTIVSVEPSNLILNKGENRTIKVTLRNDGGGWCNKSNPGLSYTIFAPDLVFNGACLSLPLFQEQKVQQRIALDKGDTDSFEIELGEDAFASFELSNSLAAIAKQMGAEYHYGAGKYYVDLTYYVSGTVHLEPYHFTQSDNENKLSTSNLKAKSGKQVVLPINMENGDDITGFQCDIYLPDGVTCASDEYGPLVQLGDRTTTAKHTITGAMQADGALRVLCYSNSNKLFSGNSGNVANITLNIAEDVEAGDKEIRIGNIMLTNPAGDPFLPSPVTSTLNVYRYDKGDVSGDGRINVVDIAAAVGFILGTPAPTYIREAADMNEDGEIKVNDIPLLVNLILQGSPAEAASPVRVKSRSADASQPMMSEGSGEIIPFSIEPGSTATVTFDLNVPETDLTSLKFDLYLPQGITVKQEYGLYLFDHADRTTYRAFTIASADNGEHEIIPGMEFVRVVCYSMSNATFKGREGALISIPLEAASDMAAGVYEILLKNIEAATPGSEVEKSELWLVTDSKNSVFVGDLSQAETLPALHGHFTAAATASLSDKLAGNSVITSLDLTQATAIDPTATLTAGNPNMLTYVADGQNLANAHNVVAGNSCVSLDLTDGYPFCAPQSFTADEAAYSRTLPDAGWYSLCLPFAAEMPADVRAERFSRFDEERSTIVLSETYALSADVSYVFCTSDGGTVRFSADNASVAATPATLADGLLVGTYRGVPVGQLAGKCFLQSDGSGFGPGDGMASVPAFRAYVEGEGATRFYALEHDGKITLISMPSAESSGIAVTPGQGQVTLSATSATSATSFSLRAVDGRLLHQGTIAPGQSRTIVLPAGIYVVGGVKFVVK